MIELDAPEGFTAFAVPFNGGKLLRVQTEFGDEIIGEAAVWHPDHTPLDFEVWSRHAIAFAVIGLEHRMEHA